MIGCGFMGRAHSNAWRRVANFFPELGHRPVLQAVCARDGAKVQAFAGTWGYASTETDWRRLIERSDIDAVDICVPNYSPQRHCPGGGRQWQGRPVREAAGHGRGRGRGHGGRRRAGRGAHHGLVQLPPRAVGKPRQAAGRGGPDRPALPLSGAVPPGLDHRRGPAAGRGRLVAAGRRVSRLRRHRRPAGPQHRYRHVAERADHQGPGRDRNLREGTVAPGDRQAAAGRASTTPASSSAASPTVRWACSRARATPAATRR